MSLNLSDQISATLYPFLGSDTLGKIPAKFGFIHKICSDKDINTKCGSSISFKTCKIM